MSATLSPPPKLQFFDANGNPLVGGKLYSYIAGTTTPLATYVNSSGTTTNTNPVILDSRGEANVWLGAATYKLALYSATNVLIWTVDDVTGAGSSTLAALAASGGSNLIGYLPAGTGAVATTVQTKLRESVSVKDFGAVGDGVTDDSTALQAAIDYCRTQSGTSLFFPTGIYKINTTLVLGNNGTKGICLVGQTASSQQGSSRPAVTIRWGGGASAMFNINYTNFKFYNIAFENFGSATDVFYLTSTLPGYSSGAAQYITIDNCSFVVGSGATRFSRSVIYALGNQFGYSTVSNCQVENPAPRFFNIDGNGTPNGVTPILFYNNVFESNASGAFTVVFIIDESFDVITFTENTFNGQANAQLTIVNTYSPGSNEIQCLNFYSNEIDLVANTATDRCFNLQNVKNINFWGNQIQAGGTVTAIGDLVSSTVTSFYGNSARSINGPVFSCDANSRVFSGQNRFDNSNTQGIASDPGTGKGGSVLQVVTTTFSTQTLLTTGWVDFASTSITPTQKTSKILIGISVNGIGAPAGTTAQSYLGKNGANTTTYIVDDAISSFSGSYVDAPNTTSAVSYSVRVKKNGAGNAYVCFGGGSISVTLMELAN